VTVDVTRQSPAVATDRGIPRSLKPFFQEYVLEELDPERDRATIIERTLRYGNRAELRWLFGQYSEETIADWVRRWGRFGLPAPHLAFWRLCLGLDGIRQ
jgi:hypothetical protein